MSCRRALGDPPSPAPKRRAVTFTTPPGPSTTAAALAEACGIFGAVLAGTWQRPDLHAPAALAGIFTRLHAAVVGEHVSEHTWQRFYASCLRRLQAIAGEQAWREAILSMRGNGRAAANPDGVLAFSDEEIAVLCGRIQSSLLSPADLAAWDCLSCFGLRPVELKGLELRRMEGVLVAVMSHEKRNRRGKSGARTVPAVPPTGWSADCHGLLDRWREHGIQPFVAALT